MNVLDLFSGIGGFSLGLERAGMRTVAFCEIDPFCRRVLAKHWPNVPCYDDVRSLTADRLRADGIAADVICGGFPCQDISVAGTGAGIAEGTRSGLWSEYARIIGELRPRYVIVENVAALLHRGLDRVLGDLAALGFDAEWHCIPACAIGAPHVRDRVWIIAHPQHKQRGSMDTAARHGTEPNSCDKVAAVAGLARLPERRRLLTSRQITDAAASSHQWRLTEPALCRADDGLPDRVDRIKALGNAVVPQIAELIGRAIMSKEQRPGHIAKLVIGR
jgi:DNA (cytosine-5)-methyltransferase 1